MQRLIVFNSISLDGYFVDAKGGMNWGHNPKADKEWDEFVDGNAGGEGGILLFGRVTYEMMVSYWPTEMAKRNNPKVAEGMNRHAKVVFSRTMDGVSWKNTKLMKGDLISEVRKMKSASGSGIVILGSGSIVSQLTQERLIDEYQFVVVPVVLGAGRTMFEGVKDQLNLKLTKTRAFANGNVLLCYEVA